MTVVLPSPAGVGVYCCDQDQLSVLVVPDPVPETVGQLCLMIAVQLQFACIDAEG